MKPTYSKQYAIPCVLVASSEPAQDVIDYCREVGAILNSDGEEFCVELRPEVGPELWTEDALRKSLPLRCWPLGYCDCCN
jgi:hypothetical protein